MALSSTMLPLGTPAPDFALRDTDGTTVRLADSAGAPVLVVAFICNHCPYVQHLRDAIAAVARDYAERGVAFVGINSNDPEAYPEDAPARMREEKETVGYPFPYLFDESQEVAKAYRAACTPDFFVFDGERRLAYRGQFDASRPSNSVPVTGEDLRAALDAVLHGLAPSAEQVPSIGCGIKWLPGNEPDYAR